MNSLLELMRRNFFNEKRLFDFSFFLSSHVERLSVDTERDLRGAGSGIGVEL